MSGSGGVFGSELALPSRVAGWPRGTFCGAPALAMGACAQPWHMFAVALAVIIGLVRDEIVTVTDPGGVPLAFAKTWTPLYRDAPLLARTVTVEGFRAKDASNTMTARSVTTADGRKMFAGTATDGGPGSSKQ